MKYNTETPQHILDEYVARNKERWDQLSSLIIPAVTDGIKYLFAINAGGAVAMLAFVGSSAELRQQDWPWQVLGILFIGIIFVGFLHIARYHTIEYLINNWSKDLTKFYDGQIDYDELNSNDDQRVKKTEWILVFGYLSFFSFIAAGLTAFCGLRSL